VFEPLAEIKNPADHPFAALKGLHADRLPTVDNGAPKRSGDEEDR
jgi:hypothetical protein